MISKFTLAGISIEGTCVDVYDGDTATFAIQPFFGKIIDLRGERDLGVFAIHGRMLGYNSAEIRTKNMEEKSAGLRAKDHLAGKILNRKCRIDIISEDKYGGRWIVDVFVDNANINKQMVVEGYGKIYDGHGEKTW